MQTTHILSEEKSLDTHAHILKQMAMLKNEDTINMTNTKRPVARYNILLKINLKQMIIDQSIQKKRKIHLLDAGCGKGIAIDELLSDKTLDPYLATCTGISKDYFSNIQHVYEKHTDRFVYHNETVQTILEKESSQYDIIVDTWGAFMYSVDRLALLGLYYDALSEGGAANVYVQNKSAFTIKENSDKFNLLSICDTYPHLFTKHLATKSRLSAITMTKQDEPFPLHQYEVSEYKEVSVYKTISMKKFDLLHHGHAVKVSSVKYVPSPNADEPYQLAPFRP